MQCLYPFVHYTFRVAEVLLRGGHIHVPSRVPQNRGSSPHHGGPTSLPDLLHSSGTRPTRRFSVCTWSWLSRCLLLTSHTSWISQTSCSQHEASVAMCCSCVSWHPFSSFSAIWGVGSKTCLEFTLSHLHTFPKRQGCGLVWSVLQTDVTDTCPGQVLCLVPCLYLLYASRRIIACEQLGLSELFARKSLVS